MIVSEAGVQLANERWKLQKKYAVVLLNVFQSERVVWLHNTNINSVGLIHYFTSNNLSLGTYMAQQKMLFIKGKHIIVDGGATIYSCYNV